MAQSQAAGQGPVIVCLRHGHGFIHNIFVAKPKRRALRGYHEEICTPNDAAYAREGRIFPSLQHIGTLAKECFVQNSFSR
jgi:hypothetical protein